MDWSGCDFRLASIELLVKMGKERRKEDFSLSASLASERLVLLQTFRACFGSLIISWFL